VYREATQARVDLVEEVADVRAGASGAPAGKARVKDHEGLIQASAGLLDARHSVGAERDQHAHVVVVDPVVDPPWVLLAVIEVGRQESTALTRW
jgi:hypothetical protein